MPEGSGVIVGYFMGDPHRHYRRELKSGEPSVTALCGLKPRPNFSWIKNLHDAYAEKRMDYPICKACEVASHS